MSTELKAAQDAAIEAKKALTELRESVDKYGQESIDVKSRLDKMDEVFEKSEKHNELMVKNHADGIKAAEELKDRIKDLEHDLATKADNNPDYKETPEYKALETFVSKGLDGIEPEMKQLLRTDDATQGGYLTMSEMDNMIIRSITEISPVRTVARVKSVGKKTLEIPVRTGIPTATYEGEAATSRRDTSTYGNETLTAYRQTVTVPYTMDQLMDSNFSLESEINQDVSEAFAQGEGRAMVLGTGSKQPEGFLSAAAGLIGDANRIRNGGSGAAGTFSTADADAIIRLTGDLKVGYNPYYSFNRRTLATLRTVKDTSGAYIFQQGIPTVGEASLAGAVPNTIAGQPYILFEDMPDIAANSVPVVYADFMRGYCVIDRTGMSMVRDELTRKREAIIEITFNRWNYGQVVLPEAFHLLQMGV